MEANPPGMLDSAMLRRRDCRFLQPKCSRRSH
jgi:hypothetical protein